jgi:hypothetical protein
MDWWSMLTYWKLIHYNTCLTTLDGLSPGWQVSLIALDDY